VFLLQINENVWMKYRVPSFYTRYRLQHTSPGDDSGMNLSLLEDIMSSHNEHVTYTTENQDTNRPTKYPQHIFMFFYTYLN